METKERVAIEDMEDIGSSGNANFAPAIQMSVRASVMMFLIAGIVWVPSIKNLFVPEIQARVALIVCLFVFTINPLLGCAIQNGLCGLLGTFWACLHMWVMNGIFPGGMKEGMSPTSATAIFGWANFLIFTFVVLWAKTGLGLKMFALATDIGFMLAFLDPKSTMVFSENFTISSKGTAVNTLIATAVACILAPLMNLIPYPMTFAYSTMKTNSVKASKDTAKLFKSIINYYGGSEASVVVESEVKHSVDLRAELDGMGGAIGAAFFEGFDLGTRGTVRALMEGHLGLLNNVYDRLRAVLIAVRTEDFGPGHTQVMNKIGDASMRLAEAVEKLLIAVTEAATDGDISSQEKDSLKKLVSDAKDAVKQLSKDFDGARRAAGKPIDEAMLGENFFVLSISAYARLVIEYTEMMLTNPPQGTGLGAAIVGNIKGTWDMSALTERFNMNFTIVHYTAIVLCWFYSVYVDNWGGGCVITAVFLMSTNVCPDIQAFLNVLNAVILAVVAGTLVFQYSCGTGYGDYLLPFMAFFLWTVGLYGVFAKSVFLLPCLVFTALTPFRWVTQCPSGEIAAGARALWGGMVANILAILFVCTCQYLMAADRANNLATNAIDDAFGGLRKAFDTFWQQKDATEPMSSVPGSLGAGSGFNGSAAIEPRFWRNGWKSGLYTEMVAHVGQIRLDILMLYWAMSGSDGKPDGIFDKFNDCKDFEQVKADLNATLEDAHTLAISILSHETGSFKGLSKLKHTTGIDTLDQMPGLVKALSGVLKFPAGVPDSMEDDELCQISTVLLMLDCTIKHMATLMKGAIRQS